MQDEVEYPPWVKEILKKISVTIYLEKGKQILRKNEPINNLRSKHLSSGGSEFKQRAFIIGFEDYEKVWNKPPDCGDIIVKIYNLGEPRKYRVEIFCSGVNKKIIYFEGREILVYEGYREEDIKARRQVKGTVIFDVTLPA